MTKKQYPRQFTSAATPKKPVDRFNVFDGSNSHRGPLRECRHPQCHVLSDEVYCPIHAGRLGYKEDE